MWMRRIAGVLAALAVAPAAPGCREGPDRAEATPRAPPGDPGPGPARPPATEAEQPGGPGAPAPPQADQATPGPPGAATSRGGPRFDVGEPWAMGLVDVQGRGVMIERLAMESFTMPLLQPGDIIIRVDDRAVTTSGEIERYLRSIPPGSMVVITVQRDDETHYVMLQVPPFEAPHASPPIEVPPAVPPDQLP